MSFRRSSAAWKTHVDVAADAVVSDFDQSCATHVAFLRKLNHIQLDRSFFYQRVLDKAF